MRVISFSTKTIAHQALSADALREDVPSSVELQWRPECDHQAAVTF